MERKINIGQRVSKSEQNPVGWVDLECKDIAGQKPIIICFGGSATIKPEMANGMCKRMELFLGIEDFPQEDKPCEIYSIVYPVSCCKKERLYYEAKSRGEDFDVSTLQPTSQDNVRVVDQFSKDLVDNVLTRYVSENGRRIDAKEAAIRMRNVNFVSFCYGSLIQLAVNLQLRDKLLELGYSADECKLIESQACVLQNAPYTEESKTGQTTVSFISLNDAEVIGKPIQQYTMEKGDERPVGQVIPSENDKTVVYVNGLTTDAGGDEHSGSYYMGFKEDWENVNEEEVRGDILPVCMAQCLRKAIENSYCNARSHNYVPINQATFDRSCTKFIDWANQANSSHEIAEALTEIMHRPVNYEYMNLMETLTR